MSQEKEIKKEQEEVEEALKENEAQSEDAVENENTVEASKETADADTTDKASEEVKEEGKKSLFGKKKNPLQDKLDDMSTAEQFKAVCTIVKQIFTGLTDDEIMLADMQDVFSIYKQASRQGLNSSNEKN